jgi:hypothetical protein
LEALIISSHRSVTTLINPFRVLHSQSEEEEEEEEEEGGLLTVFHIGYLVLVIFLIMS